MRAARCPFPLFLFAFACLALANSASAGDDWLPINAADLALKDNPSSPGSHAMILYRQEHTDSQHAFVTEYFRIKIFTEQGKEQGNVEIPFVKGHDHVEDLRARTILPNGTIVPFSGQVFEKEIVKAGGFKMLEKTFSMPDVQPGCIIEYKYKLQKDPHYYWNVGWDVQEDLFTRDADFSIRLPVGLGSPTVVSRTFDLPQAVKIAKEENGDAGVTLHNIPGIVREDYMPPDEMLRGRVDFSFEYPGAEQQTTDQYWKQAAQIMDAFIEKYIGDKNDLQKMVTQVAASADPPETKLRKLYTRVQSIRNLSYEDLTSQEWKRQKIQDNKSVQDVLKHNYAYSREINYAFLGLAQAAGFDANEVFLASRNKHALMPDLHDVSEFDDDVIRVKLSGQDEYLDPGAKFYPFGILPWQDTGVDDAFLIDKEGSFVKIPKPGSTNAVTIRRATLRLGEDGSLSGPLEVDFTGIRACVIRQNERNDDEVGRNKDMADEIKSWLPAGSEFQITKISGWDDSSAPLVISGAVAIPTYATTAGHKVLLPLTPFIPLEAASFQSARRVNDIYFEFPYEQRDDISIVLPPNYLVESLPQQVPTVMLQSLQYSISSEKQGNTIQVKRTLDVDDVLYPVTFYSALRQAFSSVKTGDDEQAVLESVASAHQN